MNQPKASAHLDCADAFYYDKQIDQRPNLSNLIHSHRI